MPGLAGLEAFHDIQIDQRVAAVILFGMRAQFRPRPKPLEGVFTPLYHSRYPLCVILFVCFASPRIPARRHASFSYLFAV